MLRLSQVSLSAASSLAGASSCASTTASRRGRRKGPHHQRTSKLQGPAAAQCYRAIGTKAALSQSALGTAGCSTSAPHGRKEKRRCGGAGKTEGGRPKRGTASVACSSSGNEGGSESSSEGFVPFPFDKDDYIEVAMQLLHPFRSDTEVQQATLILYARDGNFLEMVKDKGDGDSDKSSTQQDQTMQILSKIKDEKCLVVEIGGDTVSNISAALESTQFARPLALDLLWQVLERGQAISKNDWALVRVAIVDLRGGTFIGRLFFGDRDLGKIYWDCDCRPSDGVWLALKSKCPVFVSKSVWNLAAVPLSKLVVMSKEQQDDLDNMRADEDAQVFYSEEGLGQDADFPLLGLKTEDPEPIKRLKRELQVALAEEDYGSAIRIRDHPFMMLYSEIETKRAEGNEEEATMLTEELNRAIQESKESDQD